MALVAQLTCLAVALLATVAQGEEGSLRGAAERPAFPTQLENSTKPIPALLGNRTKAIPAELGNGTKAIPTLFGNRTKAANSAAAAAAAAAGGKVAFNVNLNVNLNRLIDQIGNAFGDRNKVCGPNDSAVFYEGNGCQENTVGSVRPVNGCGGVNIKRMSCWDNDEARSVLITSRFPVGGRIRVCDHPHACNKDDETWIRLNRRLAPNEVYCVRSFERSYSDDYVRVTAIKKNGIDGKVSQATACFR